MGCAPSCVWCEPPLLTLAVGSCRRVAFVCAGGLTSLCVLRAACCVLQGKFPGMGDVGDRLFGTKPAAAHDVKVEAKPAATAAAADSALSSAGGAGAGAGSASRPTRGAKRGKPE